MRISSRRVRLATGAALTALVGGLCVGLGLGVDSRGLLEPALAFDGTATPATASLTPGDQLLLEAVTVRVKSRTGHVRCKAFVGDKLAAEADIKFMLVDAEPV